MEKSSFDFSKPPSMGPINEAKPDGLNGTQKMIRRQGGRVVMPMIGLSYILS